MYIHKNRFEWDDEKNEINKKKHGIDFETATLVFDDAFCVTFIDLESRGEERWHTIGSIGNIIVIVVVHTYREEGLDEVIRIPRWPPGLLHFWQHESAPPLKILMRG